MLNRKIQHNLTMSNNDSTDLNKYIFSSNDKYWLS